MSILSKYILYTPNDMSSVFNFIRSGPLSPETLGKIDFFSNYFLYTALKCYGPVLGANILWALSLVFNILLSYIALSRILKSRVIVALFSLIYSFSVFFILRVTSFTFNLYLLSIFPVLIYLLNNKSLSSYAGFYCFLIFLVSSYYGFFCLLLAFFWILYCLISGQWGFKEYLKKIFLLIAPVLIGILIFFFPVLKSNLTFSSEYTREGSESRYPSESPVVFRPLEDFYNLSFRPWYFFIPPKSSVFFGEFSKNIHKRIEDTNYYLADDYMEEEMAGSYMGWHFLLGMGVVATLLLLKKLKNKEFKTFKTVYENKEMIIRSFFIIFCILLISGPPSFTIGGVEIYTPSYLLYYIVPVFRTLVRWAVVIYLFVLIINSYLVQDLYNLMKNKFQKVLFILTFLSLNFVIFAIKIPVINVNKPPEEIAFVKREYPESVSYAVYPKGDYYSIFWIISHEDKLINPVNYVNYETGFDSNNFSEKLITKEGIQEFLKHNPKYLIYYPDRISEGDLEKITQNNPEIKNKEGIDRFFLEYIGDKIFSKNNIFVYNVEDGSN